MLPSRELMTLADKRLLDEYRAIGTPAYIRAQLKSPYPVDDSYAPLPYSDPAMEAVAAYEDAWDYPAPEQQKRYSGLLEDEA